MVERTCSIDGCERLAFSRGWCNKHYHRWYTHGDPNTVKPRGLPRRPVATCSVDGCEDLVASRDWCIRHYTRWKRHGDPIAPGVREFYRGTATVCAVEGCNSSRRKGALCAGHYSQKLKTGQPPKPFKYKWATEKRCRCGATDWPDNGRRGHCSSRCEVLSSRERHGGNVRSEMTCIDCGKVVDISVQQGKRKVRSDSKRCAECAGRKTFKMVRGGPDVSIGVVRRLGTHCGICSEPVDFSLRAPNPLAPSVDHIEPVALGGGNEASNIQLAHLGCNQGKHLRPANRDYGRAKRQTFYLLYPWKKFSRQIRREEPNCRVCHAPAFCVDHIVAIEDGGDPWDRANLQPLCRRCHNRKSQHEYYARCSAGGFNNHEDGVA